MTLPASGPLSLGDIAGEFGGSVPHAISEYYGADAGVPASGAISISDFYGTSALGPVTFIGSANARAASVSLPAHQSGDLILIVAHNGDNGTEPSLPAGWSNLASANLFSTRGIRFGYKFASSSSEVSGTWTNCDNIVCAIYRNVVSIGNTTTANSGGSTNEASWPSNTPNTSPGFLVALGSCGSSAVISGTPMTGFTSRENYADTVPNSVRNVVYDTNGDVASFGGQDDASTNTGLWLTAVIELSQS